jgi:uncharacterized HAD superfamily protein
MKIAIDLDNTITFAPKFFSQLTHSLKENNYVYVITNRDMSIWADTKKELRDLGIHYNHLIFTADKKTAIIENEIEALFEDTDEYFLDVPEEIVVLKIREPGNFDFTKKKWIYGNRTGINIDD